MSDAIGKNTNFNHPVSLTNKEVGDIIENPIKQAYTINQVNEKTVNSLVTKEKESILAPILKIPDERKNERETINIKSSAQFEVKTFFQNKLDNKNDFYHLQLSYQGLINENILDKIKDTDKFDYYLEKMEHLSEQVEQLKEKYQSILNEAKKYQTANADYWFEIYNEIKNKNLTVEETIEFLSNKNIPSSLAEALVPTKINSSTEMAAFLKSKFPSLQLPDDVSHYSLSDFEELQTRLLSYFNDLSSLMPQVSISDDKLKSISSYFNELKNLIENKDDPVLKNKMEEVRKAHTDLILSKSRIELEIASHTLSGMALLTFLLAKVRELTMKVMLQRSENEQKLFEEMQVVTEKSLKDKVADQKAQIKKQEEIQYWAGIGLKILGGLVAIFAGIASIFTAGASLALMAVAVTLFVADVALTVADEIYQAIHGESFMDEIMAPISEAIMKVIDKIVDALVSMFEASLDLLKELGIVDKVNDIKKALHDKIKMAFKILVTIVLFVAAIALTFVAGPAVNGITNAAKKIFNEQVKQTLKKILNDYLEKMLGNMIKEIIMQAMEEIMKAINKAITKITDNVLLQKMTAALNKISHMITEDMSEKAISTIHRTAVGSRLLKLAASSTIHIYSSTISADIMRSVADSKKLNAILDLIQKLMDQIMEGYNDNVDTMTEILKSMSESSSVSNKVKSNVIRNISA